MAKKYKLEQSSLSSHERFLRLYETFLHEVPLPNSPTDFTVRFRNGKSRLIDTIEGAQVLRDWLLEAPNTRPVAPFEEHIYDITKDGLQWFGRQRNIPGYVDKHIREKYEREVWGGAPEWITIRPKNILPRDFRNVVQNLTLPGWEVQDAEIIVKQNYRTGQRLRFGLNKKGVEVACFTENDDLENWLKRVAKEYDTELIQEETEDRGVELPSNIVYRFTDYGNYAQGVQRLREAQERGEHVLDRPLTFGENLVGRLQDQDLFNNWLWSCTGIAYKAGSSRFKIIHECDQLIDIEPNFNQGFIAVNYDDLAGDNVIEFDRNDATYNGLLTRDQVLNHPAWQAAVGDDKLLQDYTTEVFQRFNRSTAMGFWLRNNIDTDQLRALCVDSIDDGSGAVGSGNLSDRCARFALVAPSGAP
jgi:hypothetical protein